MQVTPPQFRLAVGPPYRSKNFCRSSCFEVVCITSIARILAFCGGKLSAVRPSKDFHTNIRVDR